MITTINKKEVVTSFKLTIELENPEEIKTFRKLLECASLGSRLRLTGVVLPEQLMIDNLHRILIQQGI